MTPNELPAHAELADFQAALIELLALPLAPSEMLGRLQNDAAFAPFTEYVATFDLRMVEVAAELVKKWGRRSSGAPSPSEADKKRDFAP